MSNTGLLNGMQCPQCDSYGPFNIETLAVIEVRDSAVEGWNQRYGAEWTNDSWCQCVECSYTKTVGEFKIKNWVKS